MDQNTIASYCLRPLLPSLWEEMEEINSTSSNTYANILFQNPMYLDINEQNSNEIYNEKSAYSSTCLVDGDEVFENEVEEKKELYFQKVLQPTNTEENALGFELMRKYSSCLGDKGWCNITFKFSMNLHIALEKILNARRIKSYKYTLEKIPYLEYSQNKKEEIEYDTGEEKKISQNEKYFYPPTVPADKIMDAEICCKSPCTTRTELIPLLTCQGYENTTRKKLLSSRRKLTSTETVQQRIILDSSKNKNIARTADEKATHGRPTELPCKTVHISHGRRKIVDKVFSNTNSDSIIKKCVNNRAHNEDTRKYSQIKGNKYLHPLVKEFRRKQSLSPQIRAEDKRINEAKLNVRNIEMDLIKQKTQRKLCSVSVDNILPNSKLRFSNIPTTPLLSKSSKSFNTNPGLKFKKMQIHWIKEARKSCNVFQPVLERNKALVDKTKPRIMSCLNKTESNREMDILRNSETIPLNPLLERSSSDVREYISQSDLFENSGIERRRTDASELILVADEAIKEITISNKETAAGKIHNDKNKINLQNERSHYEVINFVNDAVDSKIIFLEGNYSHRENKSIPKYAPGRENIKSLFSILDKKYSKPEYVKNTILNNEAENIETCDSENSNEMSQKPLFEGIFSIEGNVPSQLNKTFSKDITKRNYENKTDEENVFHQQRDNPLSYNKEITIITSRNSLLNINDLHISNDIRKDDTRTQSKDSLLSCGEDNSRKLDTLQNNVFREHFFKVKQMDSLTKITGNTAENPSLSTLGRSINQSRHSLEYFDKKGKISWNLNHMDVKSNSNSEPQTTSLLDHYLHRKINMSRAENLHQEGHRLFSGNVGKIDTISGISSLEAYFNLKYGCHKHKENTSADNSKNNKKYKISFTQEINPDQQFEDKTEIKTERIGGEKYANNLELNPHTDKNTINFLTWKSYTLDGKDISNIKERETNEFPLRETKIAYNVTPEANMLDVSNLNISECSSSVYKSMNTAKFPYDGINFDFTSDSKISQKLISYTPTQKNTAKDTLTSNSLLKEEGSSQIISELQDTSVKDKLQSQINTQDKYLFLRDTKDMKSNNTHFISYTNSPQFRGDKIEKQNLFTTNIPTYKKLNRNVPKSKEKKTNIQESNLKFNNQINRHLDKYAAIEETNHNSNIMRNNNHEVLSFNSNNSPTWTQTLRSYLLGASISFQDYTNLLKKEMKDCRTVMKRRNITNKM